MEGNMSEKIFGNAAKRVFLVTGASGFLGKEIVKHILSEGGKVIAADMRTAPQLKEINNPNLELWEVNLTGDFAMPKGVTDVIHAAGKVADWGSYESFYNINVAATEKLMKLAKESKVKNFLFISSIDIHGFFGHNEETEDGTYYPSKCFYPATKTIAENMVKAFNSPEMKTVCIRPCTVYGPGDTTVQGPIMDAIIKGQMGFIDKGKRLITRIYVTDLVQGLCKALEKGRGGEAYNIVSGEKINWMEWVEAIAKELNVKTPTTTAPYWAALTVASIMEGVYKLFRSKTPPLLTRMRIQHAGHDFYFVPTKAKTELGFEPQMPWKEGIKLMVEEYKARKGIK
ncbi:MAG: NAD-dependent epimerase/dehydratase family protein [Clostridia bacterium]|nr:NAD-dependent epimerase/dehydratase family protein [Clostridia bacterium]